MHTGLKTIATKRTLLRATSLLAVLASTSAFAGSGPSYCDQKYNPWRTATEGDRSTFYLKQGGEVYYGTGLPACDQKAVSWGIGGKGTRKSLPAGTHRCHNSTFGDPAPGQRKYCVFPK